MSIGNGQVQISNINLQKGTIDFYGDEYSLFTKYLNVFFRHTIASKRSSSFCPKKELQEEFKSHPSLIAKASMILLRI